MRTTTSRAKWLALVLSGACAILANSPSRSASVKLITAPLIAPGTATGQAWNYYSSLGTASTSHTHGVAAWSVEPAEIVELSRALGAGRYSAADYLLTVYEYVRNNISMDFRFGLSKGARGAVIDQSGTPFDQAHLLVELLRQGNSIGGYGLTVNYIVGTISLTATQFQAWTGLGDPATGLINAATACQFLADGGIPATISGSTNCGALNGPLSATGTPVVMGHIWVIVTGAQLPNPELLDPSYKIHVIKTGVDLASKMNCGTAASPTCGTTALSYVPSATTLAGVSPTVPVVQNVNQAGLESSLGNFATTLQLQYIQATNAANQSTNPNMQVEDLIGGSLIDLNQALPASGNAQISELASTAYSAAAFTWSGDIPDAFRSTELVKFDNFNSGAGQLFYADELAGGRLRIWGYPYDQTATGATRSLVLYYEYRPIATSSVSNATGSLSPLTLTIQHPYAANGGTYASETLSYDVKIQANGCEYPSVNYLYGSCSATGLSNDWYLGVVTIVNGWGISTENTVSHYAAVQARDVTNAFPENPSDPKHLWLQKFRQTGAAPYTCVASVTTLPSSPPYPPFFLGVGCFEQHQPAVAANWLAQTSRASSMLGQINGVSIQSHHTAGVVVSGLSTGLFTQLNFQSSISTNAKTANTANRVTDRKAAHASLSTMEGRLEGSVLGQMLDSIIGGDGVSMLALANAQHTNLLQLDQTNFNTTAQHSAVEATLSNYPAATLASLESLVQAGFSLTVPQNGNTPGPCDTNNLCYPLRYAGISAISAAQAGYLTAGTFMTTGLDGGSGGVGAVDPSAAVTNSTKTLEYSTLGRQRYGVNLVSGELTLNPAPDLVTGAGDFPFSLSYQRYYSERQAAPITFPAFGDTSAARHGLLTPGGWSSSLNIYGKFGSDGLAAMGRDSALNAAAAVAGMYVLRTLNTGTQDIRTNLASAFVANWIGEGFYDNTVTITRPPKSSVFVRLANGSYNPEPGSAERLTQTGTRSPSFYDTSILVMDPRSVVFTLTDRTGSVLTLPYVSAGSSGIREDDTNLFVPNSWTFPNGVILNFTYTESACPTALASIVCLSSVTNNLGRSLSFPGTASPGVLVQDDSSRKVLYSTTWVTTNPGTVDSAFPASISFTAPDGGVSTYNYLSNPVGEGDGSPPIARQWSHIFSWITPLGGTPYFTAQYDSLYRVMSLTDNSTPANTTNYFTTGIYGRENQRRGEISEPRGLLSKNPTSTSYFDVNGAAVQVVDPLGRTTSSTYDTSKRLAKVVHPEGNFDSYSYDIRSNLLSLSHAPKPGSSLPTSTETNTYLEGPTVFPCVSPVTCNLIQTSQDPNLNVTTYSYLSSGTGQLQRATGPAITAAPAPSINGNPQIDYCYISVAGASGSISLLQASITKVDSSNVRVKSYAYSTLQNHLSLSTSTVDPANSLVAPTSAGGTCSSTTKPGALGLVTTYLFDSVGNVSSIDGPIAGTLDTTSFTFDSMRRLTWIQQPGSQFTRYCYDLDGQLTSTNQVRPTPGSPTVPLTSTDPTGTAGSTGQCAPNSFPVATWLTETKSYFPSGDLQSIADAAGHTTTFAYDPVGRRQVVQDPDGRQTATVFDLAGEVIATWKGGSGWISSGIPSGTWPSTWNPASYAGTGPLRYESYCNGTSCYSLNGRPLYAIDADNNTTAYQYDGLDRLRITYFPDPTTGTLCTQASNDSSNPTCAAHQTYELSGYDRVGNRVSFRTRKSDVINYSFDALNRLYSKSPAGQGTVLTGYDLVGEPRQVSKAASGSFPAHTIVYAYDANGRAISEFNEDGLGVTHSYDTLVTTNDNAGSRTRTSWSDGYYVTYQYDSAARLQNVRENSVSSSELAFYYYDTLSRRTKLCLGGQSTACTAGSGTNRVDYSYEPDSQLGGLSHTLNNATANFTYSRNSSYQLTNLSVNDAFYLPTPVASSLTSYTPNSLNEYGAIAGQTLTYDDNGNLLSWLAPDGQQTFTYDSENRLIAAAVRGSGTPSISYDYDGLGRRVSKTVSGVTTKYLLDGDDEVAEYSGTTILRRFIDGPSTDERLVHVEGNTLTNPPKTFYHTNHQESVIAISDSAGSISQRMSYDEYGNSSTASGEPYGYTGRRFDPETGLYFYRARYYSPRLGRFLQPDQVGYKDDLDLYTYAANDPLDHTDPSGNELGTASWLKQSNALADALPVDDESLWTVLSFVPVASEGVAVKDFVEDPNMETFVVVAASLVDLGGFVRVGRKIAKAEREMNRLPKPPRGKGAVPPDQRDPKRFWTKKEHNAKHEQQTGKCRECGEDVSAEDSESHHINRHADGYPTDDPNHAVVCKPCHKKLHKPDPKPPNGQGPNHVAGRSESTLD